MQITEIVLMSILIKRIEKLKIVEKRMIVAPTCSNVLQPTKENIARDQLTLY